MTRFVLRLLMLSALFSLGFIAPARADLEVHSRIDTVVMADGTEVPCIILMVSARAVLIVEADPADPEKKTQRVIPRADVKEIIRGERKGIEGLQTDSELARKVIHGSGFRKEETGGKEADGKIAGKDAGSKKSPVADAKVPSNSATNSKKAGGDSVIKSTGPAINGVEPTVALPAGTLSGKELSEAYLGRYPELQSLGMELLGPAGLQNWFDAARNGSDTSRKQTENFLKAYLGAPEKEKTATSKTPLPPKSAPIRRLAPAPAEDPKP